MCQHFIEEALLFTSSFLLWWYRRTSFGDVMTMFLTNDGHLQVQVASEAIQGIFFNPQVAVTADISCYDDDLLRSEF